MGWGGYFAKRGSVRDSEQRRKREPLGVTTSLIFEHVSHRLRGINPGLPHGVRGQYMMTATPIRAMRPPITSAWSGLMPSTHQPHKSERAMKTPP